MFSSGWWPAQMVQWTKLLLISLVIDSILFFFKSKKKQRKKWRKTQPSLCCVAHFFLCFYLIDHTGNDLNMVILHVVPSNIYETLRWKLWRSDVYLFFSLFTRKNTFCCFICFWWKPMLMALIAFIYHPSVTHKSTRSHYCRHSAWLYSSEHLKKGVILQLQSYIFIC